MNLGNKGDHNKMSDKKSNWIWLPTWTAEDKENPALVLFRKEVLPAMVVSSLIVMLIRFLAAHYRWNLPRIGE